MKVPLIVSMLSLVGKINNAFSPKVRPTTTFRSVALFATKAPASSRNISSELTNMFNSQVTNELSASQLYLSASIWCDQCDLVGMASYMRRESEEERGHALEFVDFANKRNIKLRLEDIEAPDAEWATVEEMWEDLIEAEEDNTQSLLELGDEAANCRDHALSAFLQPFHMEQVDSEDKLRTILSKVRDENKTPGLLRQLDTELGCEASSHS